MAKREQRVFTKEFKQEAVRLAQTSGKSMTQLARDLGIYDSAFCSASTCEHSIKPRQGH
ncbi:MAG: transposase [Ktedonobacteraceae bacterium]